jgi:ABC-type multidrug transport system fused ATPase/permease subunit
VTPLGNFFYDLTNIFFFFKENSPNMPVDEALIRLYPYKSFLSKDGQNMVDDLLKNLGIEKSTLSEPSIPFSLSQIRPDYVSNPYHDQVIGQLEQSVRVHDVCLIGPRGSGKSTLVKQLAIRLGQDIEPIMLYQVGLNYFLSF